MDIISSYTNTTKFSKKKNIHITQVVIPDGVLGLPNDMADLLLSQHAPPKGEE